MTGRTRRWLAAAAGCSMLVVASSACATTYDDSLATAVPATAAAATTTLPTGPADVLLPRLVAEANGLSGVMIDGGDENAAVRRIEELWTAVKQEVNAERPDLLSDFSTNVELTAHAVRFNRSADADKAAKNLTFLATAYLSR